MARSLLSGVNPQGRQKSPVTRHPSPGRDREGEVGGVSRSPLPCRSATMLTAYLTGDGRSLQSAAPSNSFCAYPLAVTPCGLCELSAPPSARLVSTRPAPAFCGAPQLSSANETTKQQGHADVTGLNASVSIHEIIMKSSNAFVHAASCTHITHSSCRKGCLLEQHPPRRNQQEIIIHRTIIGFIK